jgi:hypothetical protein
MLIWPSFYLQIEAGDIDPEDLEEIEERLEVDYQVGEDLKEKVGFWFLVFVYRLVSVRGMTDDLGGFAFPSRSAPMHRAGR